jgi:poly(glycerol-phosphate) alpha-glucosyltransferase
MPQGRYLSCVVDVSPDAGGQTRAMLMRNRIFARTAGVRPTVLTFGPTTDYAERREVLLERGLLIPEISLLNIYEHYRDNDWGVRDDTGEHLEDLSDHVVGQKEFSDGSPWRTTHRLPGATTAIHDYLRRDGTPFLRIPELIYKEPGTWPKNILAITRTGEVARVFRSLGQWWRLWVRELTQADERAFVFIDSRHAVPHLVPMLAPHIHIVYVLHNIHIKPPRRWDSEVVTPAYQHVLDRIPGMDAMVTLTHRQREDIAQRHGDTENLFVVPNPVDMPEPVDVPRDPRRVALVARLEAQKRPAQAIDAFARVVKEVPEAHLDIYGSGSRFGALTRQRHLLGLENSVTLHGHDPRAREALSRSSAFLMTSSFEGYPLSTLESMSHGCPVVSYDIKYGPREQITDGVDGFLVPEGDTEQLAERVVRLLKSPELVERMSRAAVEKAEQHGTDNFIADWAAVLEKVMEQKPHRTRLAGAELDIAEVFVRRRGALSRVARHARRQAPGRFRDGDVLRFKGSLRVEVKGPPRNLAAARIDLAAVFYESGAVVPMPVKWSRDGTVFHLRGKLPLRGLRSPLREDAADKTVEQAGLRLRLVWRNSVWEGWVQRPAEETSAISAIEVAYVASGRLMVRSQRRR